VNAEELGRLDQFLLFGVAYDEGMTLDTLDCYLYAIAPSGPRTIMPSKWFPKVWGEESTTPPMEKID
jgi:hypothetical protein